MFNLVVLLCLTKFCASQTITSSVTLTHYSDAQCPCSARVPQDIQTHFLNNTAWENITISFQQYFVGDLSKNISKCIHGEEECVAQRHFCCAQHYNPNQWLSFEQCSYGNCTDCPAIEGAHCPCATYTTFPQYTKNNQMKTCALKYGYDWNQLHNCGTSSMGQHLMEISSNTSNHNGVTYGVDGLAPIYLNGIKIQTKQLIPFVCGPTPKEIKQAICKLLKDQGKQQVVNICQSESEPEPTLSLRAAGSQAGIFMGSQFKLSEIQNTTDPKYRSTHESQYALSTVGNVCKWESTHPKQDTFDLSKCIAAFNYSLSANQQFRGHNLCWGNNNPSWLLNGGFDKDELETILQHHVTTVMQGVSSSGRSPFAWDVVNEACVSQEEYEANGGLAGNANYFKNNVWYPKLSNYVDVAFIAARKADPNALLFYNDYGQNQWSGKADVVYNMVKSMIDRGIPIGGVGMQQHLAIGNIQNVEQFEKTLQKNIARLVNLDLVVHITEFDIKCPDNPTCDLEKQADIYGAAVRACLANKPNTTTIGAAGCQSFETWGFTDKVSWLNGERCKPVEGPCHALPFNEQYQPKPAVASMLQVLKGGAK